MTAVSSVSWHSNQEWHSIPIRYSKTHENYCVVHVWKGFYHQIRGTTLVTVMKKPVCSYRHQAALRFMHAHSFLAVLLIRVVCTAYTALHQAVCTHYEYEIRSPCDLSRDFLSEFATGPTNMSLRKIFIFDAIKLIFRHYYLHKSWLF